MFAEGTSVQRHRFNVNKQQKGVVKIPSIWRKTTLSGVVVTNVIGGDVLMATLSLSGIGAK